MAIRLFFILSLIATIALSQETATVKGEISHLNAVVGTFGTWNVHSTATLNIQHTVGVNVCLNRQEFMLPNATQYSEATCEFFYHLANTTDQIREPAILFANYSIGIYLANDTNTTLKANVTVHITADVCAVGTYWSGSACINAVAVQNATVPFSLKKGETAFFTYNNPERTPKLVAQIKSAAEAELFTIYTRYSGVPSADHHNGVDANLTVSVDLPRPGSWVYAVHASENAEGEFSVHGDSCAPGRAGPDCPAIAPLTNNASLTITSPGKSDFYYYFTFTATHEQILLVSVTTENATYLPSLWATRGQLPALDGSNSDIKNCNGGYCDVVKSIERNLTFAGVAGPEEWFIAVVSTLHTGNTTFAIWFNQTCIFGCTTDNRGTCLDTGLCDCGINWSGVDCSNWLGLGPHYIVLIIIAALVVSSAIIGFVAWAYMRRKRQNYEILS